MQLRQDNSQRQAQSQKIAPHQIQANLLLQCSHQELLQLIEQERRENPALDSDEDDLTPDACRDCRRPGPRPCAACPFRHDTTELAAADETPAAEEFAALAGSGDDTADDERQASREELELTRLDSAGLDTPASDGDFDPLLLARAKTTLAEHLLSHLRATSQSREEVMVAEYLVSCLDERGYLQFDIDEACAVLRVPCGLVVAGVTRLQACDPPGIGARDLRECLLLQLRHRREQGEETSPLAERLVSEQWEALIQHRHAQVARRLGATPAQMETAVAFIQTRLIPRPAAQFRQPWDHRPDRESAAVRPDVIIRRAVTGFEVDVPGFDNLPIQVNAYYQGLYEKARTGDAPGKGYAARRARGAVPADQEKHVVAYVERAQMFLKNLQQRRRTIRKIALALVQCQQGFIETGQRAFLQPLTRTRLAQMVGMHESTVSRALLHKFAQLPSQEVVGFDVFFENAVTAKDAVAALIAAENPSSPLSDAAIQALLTGRGLTVARRTVVKYREELRLPASYLRRRR